MKKIKELWGTLEEEATFSKRELFFILATCSLAGIVLGAIFSPKKTMTIGSNNGNKSGCTVIEDGDEKVEE